ncbi:MAG TPA: GNAT family N-acetyltransferase [Paludibacteraceae bacterium]|nr:GNAT family N-acetyltransferase [Paludibacteraceae bacterium]HOU68594.1 GNAT family N-acetyltransferase [Paludibacteraceae bacterium]HQF50414.1 GNAT family N-acetyltransferase [Paludibacteraceae bacterium]
MCGALDNGEIRLRALEPEDLEALYKWENDDAFWEDGNAIAPYSRHILRQYIQTQDQDLYTSHQLRLMIELKESCKAIGTIDLFDFEPHNNRAGVGIMIDKDFQQKGYATQGLTLFCSYAFEVLHLHQMYAHVNTKNKASIALFQKAGFAECGLLHSWNRTADGWQDCLLFQKIRSEID